MSIHWFIKRLSNIKILYCIVLLSAFIIFSFFKIAVGEKKIKIAIIPFENISENFCDIDSFMEIVYHKLKDNNMIEFPSQEETDKVLIDLRLRHTGYLTTNSALEIGKRLGVQGILLGFIVLYNESPEPQVGVILKLISTGKDAPLVWMKTESASGSDRETWFGLKRIRDFNRFLNQFIAESVKDISFKQLEKLDPG